MAFFYRVRCTLRIQPNLLISHKISRFQQGTARPNSDSISRSLAADAAIGNQSKRVPGMGTRFAGSPRVGDRRRRLMAAGTDDVAGDSAPLEQLPAPVGRSRVVDGAHSLTPATPSQIAIGPPLSSLVPRAWWQYAIAGLLCLLIGGAMTVAGCHTSALGVLLGPQAAALFELPNGPVAKWFSSLLLLLAAQVSLFIWWARAQSLKDFDGRYWLWIRVACICLMFSGCVAIDANGICQSIVHHFRPRIGGWRLMLGWLVPAAVIGGLTVRALSREMRGCRVSRLLMLTTAGCYLTAALLGLELELPCTLATRNLLIQSVLIAGHIALFVGLWCHARHVVYCTADPASVPVRTWRIPRPHFRIPSLRLPRRRKSAPEQTHADHDAEVTPSRRKRPARNAATELASQPAPAAAPPAEPAVVEPASKPKFRIDSRHESPAGGTERTISPAAAGTAQPVERSVRDQVAIKRQPPEPAPVELSELDSENESESSYADRDASADDDASDTHSAKPDLRGLSKKQRRRLMQEMRDRERAAGR